jgi:diacylglycerol kinase (ATP)
LQGDAVSLERSLRRAFGPALALIYTVRVVLVHNPIAGDDRQPDGAELTSLIREAGHEVTYHPYTDRTWAEAVNGPVDLVAVAGGDGTIGRVAQHLIGRGVSVTFFPLGTANNISTTFGLASLTPRRLIAGWRDARRVRADVGVFESPWGCRYFVEGAGMGLFVRAMIEIDAADALGHLHTGDEKMAHASNLIGQRLPRFPARTLEIELDGRNLSGEYVMLEAMNFCFIGPNLHLAPDCDPADGQLDVVLVRESEREALATYLNDERERAKPPRLTVCKGKHLKIGWDGELMHIDDATWPTADVDESLPSMIHLRAEPQALDLLLPDVQ